LKKKKGFKRFKRWCRGQGVFFEEARRVGVAREDSACEGIDTVEEFCEKERKEKTEDERKREEGNRDGGGKRADASLETLISISVFTPATALYGAPTRRKEGDQNCSLLSSLLSVSN